MAIAIIGGVGLPSSMQRRSARYRSRLRARRLSLGCCSADNREHDMAEREIDAIRTLLGSKPRPVGWSERRAAPRRGRIDLAGGAGREMRDGRLRWRRRRVVDRARQRAFARAAVFPRRRILLRLDCKPPPPGDGGRARGVHTHACDRLPACARNIPIPAAHEDALTAWRFLRRQGIAATDIAVGGDSAGGNLDARADPAVCARRESRCPACAWLISPWTDLTMSGGTLATKDAIDPLIHKAYLAELADAYAPPLHRSPRSADLAAVCRSRGLSAHPDSGRIGRDVARGRDAACRGRRRGRCRCDAANLAAHDPCMAGLECKSRGRPARAGVRRPVHPGASSR